MKFAGIKFATNVQVLDSPDQVLILGNDWLLKTRAIIDWEQKTITVMINNKKRSSPISLTKVVPFHTKESSDEESSDGEYEDEELEETTVYFSDLSESEEAWMELFEDELRQELEHNLWKELPKFEENPAVFLAQVASAEEKPQLNHGPLTNHQQRLLNKFLEKNKDINAGSQTEIGRTNLIQHKINTGDAAPIAQTYYRTSPPKEKFLREEIAKLEEAGLVRKSISPWASPVVIVGKKDGSQRLCVNYRKLNKVTKPDMYPLLRIDDMLKRFGQAQWFTTLDLASGYWQVGMDPKDVEKTAFITPFGLYEFLVMPFGLSYVPGTFQRLMNRMLHDYLGIFVAVYLDDVIIFTKGPFEQHLDELQQVFNKLRTANLKIKIKKCYFCSPNLKFLGYVV
jgi:hypothetical protein